MARYTCEIPAKLAPLASQKARWKVARGGRGSTKSWTFARLFLLDAAWNRRRILCTREMQNSIKDSVYKLLCDQIVALGLGHRFHAYSDIITSECGSEFIFKGLHHHINEIKSIEGIDKCWVEEAATVSQNSWDILGPSIRKPGSEIWVSYNPEEEGNATDVKFGKHADPDSIIVDINYIDNPWFPDVLRQEMEHCKRTDFDKYEHIWLGKYKGYSDALVFKNKYTVREFETPPGVQLYFGADFGFSSDPSCVVRCFIGASPHTVSCPTGCRSQHLRLFIDHEAYAHGVEINELHKFFGSVPGIRNGWKVRADSSRPDTISFLSRMSKDSPPIPGFPIVGAEKGANSVEDGIQFLRGFEEIVIHPRCVGTKDNFDSYKHKVDKITGKVLPLLIDANNHVPDALRYALEPYIKAKVSIYDVPNWKMVA